MGTFSIWHWLMVLAVVLIVFGTKKLPSLTSLGKDLGGAVRGFKEGMKGEGEPADAAPAKQLAESQTIEGEVKDKPQA